MKRLRTFEHGLSPLLKLWRTLALNLESAQKRTNEIFNKNNLNRSVASADQIEEAETTAYEKFQEAAFL